PASCSFKTAMICSSLNLLRFIRIRLLCVGLYQKPVTFQGSTSDWFDTIWNDPTAIIQAKETLLQALENLAADKPANLLYFLTLFTIFRDFLDDIDEDSIIRSKTGIMKHI
ncbi:MAG: hypothetical protein ACR2O7_15225, partial [Parasphingorhabdus sp.]